MGCKKNGPARRRRRRAPADAAGAAPADAAGAAPADAAGATSTATVAADAKQAATALVEVRPPDKFLTAVRVAGFLSAAAMPRSALPHLMHVLLESRADVAAYVSPQFARVFDRTAYNIATRSRAQYISLRLPSTGTPIDLELFGDHFTVGQYFGRVGMTALILGINFPAPAPLYTGALPIALEVEQADGRSPAQMENLRQGLRRVDPHRDLADLVWRQIATSTGDGALAKGGPKARHSGTALFNALWALPRPRDAAPARAAAARAWDEEAELPLSSLVSRPADASPEASFHRGRWDDFHRYSAAGARAMNQSAACQAFFRVLKLLEARFRLWSRGADTNSLRLPPPWNFEVITKSFRVRGCRRHRESA